MPTNSDPIKPLSMNDLPDAERPRERLVAQGAAMLSTAELLAIVLGTGTRGENVVHLAERVLAHFGGLRGIAQASPPDFAHINGMGPAKTTQILASLELGRRLSRFEHKDNPIIAKAVDVVNLVSDMQDLVQEHVRVVLLDSKRRVVAIPTVYIGTMNASVLRTAEIYREAIKRNCPAIILVHNHPRSDPRPSPEDVELTRTLAAAGNLLDIMLLDHVIIGHSGWASFKEMGLVFV